MLDLANISGFQWDPGNARKSQEKHGVTSAEAEQVFLNVPLLLSEDDRHSAVEARLHALGKSHAGRVLHVTFTVRDNGIVIRVISARDANREERAIYGQET